MGITAGTHPPDLVGGPRPALQTSDLIHVGLRAGKTAPAQTA
jgi:hypothetical protein